MTPLAATGTGTGRVRGALPWLIASLLALLVGFVYWRVGSFGFVNIDDGRYVYENQHVRQGLSWRGIIWAFTRSSSSNYHPLTWVSHMADVSVFGVEPTAMHAVNALLHGCNAVLLFATLLALTRKMGRSALVASLFAVHPLHVESVAWISERKDLLCTFFGFLAILIYASWTRRSTVGRYLLIAATFSLSLAAKAMLVTLPFLLLLLDVWPLGRAGDRSALCRCVREKVPLLGLSVASSVVTYLAQSKGGSVVGSDLIPLPARLANALVATCAYLAKTIWAVRLAPAYPHPALLARGLSAAEVAGPGLLLLAVSALAVWQRVRRPYLLVGWLWYLVALLPVVGIVQVGLQGMADRYTYVPLIGVFLAGVWLTADALGPRPLARIAASLAAVAVVLTLAATARRQVGYWRDSLTLFRHAVEVAPESYAGWRNLGSAYQESGRPAEAVAALRESVRLMPSDPLSWMNLGIALIAVDEPTGAMACFDRALKLSPDDPLIWYNVGVASAILGDDRRLHEALSRIEPSHPALARQLAQKLSEEGLR